MQLAYLVHHAMNLEIARFLRSLLLKHVDEHDVNHRLHQNVGAIRSHIRYLLYPSRIIIIFLDAELQLKGICHLQLLAVRLIQKPLHESKQIFHRLGIHILA